MESERIARLTVDDAFPLLAAVRSNVEHLGRWLDTPQRVVTHEDAVRELSSAARFGCYVGDELVASVKVTDCEPGVVEVGVWGVQGHEGHGHVRSTLLFVLDQLKGRAVRTVLYRHASGNTRSESLVAELKPPGYTASCTRTPEETLWTLRVS